VQQYGVLPTKYSLDSYQDSWTAAFGLPLDRLIAPDAHVANSVALRVQYGLTYTPKNLLLDNAVLADGYSLVEVVNEEFL